MISCNDVNCWLLWSTLTDTYIQSSNDISNYSKHICSLHADPSVPLTVPISFDLEAKIFIRGKIFIIIRRSRVKFESKKKVLSVSLVLHLMAFLVVMYTLLYIFLCLCPSNRWARGIMFSRCPCICAYLHACQVGGIPWVACCQVLDINFVKILFYDGIMWNV